MKTILAALVLMTSFTTFAADNCRSNAAQAAGSKYRSENPTEAFSYRLLKPVTSDKTLYQIVEIFNQESGYKTATLTVSLNAKDCSVLSVD